MFGKKSLPETQKEIAPEDQVHLKPFLGVRPGIYLAALYTLILAALFFFILLYPGLVNPESLLFLDSEPRGAAVRVDGITLGTTPCTLFISRGERAIELILPGFKPHRETRTIPGRIFATRFFPQGITISGTLEAAEPLEAFKLGAVEYAAWSFTGEPTAAYQIPRDLSEGAYRSGPGAADPILREKMTETLKGAARFANTKAGLRDLLRAQFLADNGGLSPSPLSVTETAARVLAYLSEAPGAASWLADTLPREAARVLEDSSWYEKTLSASFALREETAAQGGSLGNSRGTSGETPRDTSNSVPPGDELTLGSLRFRRVPPGEFVLNTNFPQRVRLDNYYIASTELSSEAWEAFLAVTPQWQRENLPTLMERGLASEGYLQEPVFPPYENPGVPGISWFAAAAYCQWLTGFLPPNLASWEVRLPTEAEWERAAGILRDTDRSSGVTPVNMLGGLWEWCADFYAPLNFLPAAYEAIRAVASPERSLRGGSWINPPLSVGIETRASLPPSASPAFVSFRPVIAPKQGTP
jgi:hypothetical protein